MNKKKKSRWPLAGHHHHRSLVCYMLHNACLLEARGKQPWQHKGQTGSLLMGGERKGRVRGEGANVLELAGTTGEASLGFNWLFTWGTGSWCVSPPFPSSPLLFPFLFLCFEEGAVMGHWSGLMAMSFWFFLSSFYSVPFSFPLFLRRTIKYSVRLLSEMIILLV